MTKETKITKIICVLTGLSLMLFVMAEEGQAKSAEQAMDIIVEALHKKLRGEELQRKAVFTVENWPQNVIRFVKVEKNNMPILGEPNLTVPTLNVVGLTKFGEILQFLEERRITELSNPFGWEGVSNGVWYKVRLSDRNKEGWIFARPEGQNLPFATYFKRKPINQPQLHAQGQPQGIVSFLYYVFKDLKTVLLIFYFMALFSLLITVVSYVLDDKKRGFWWLVAGGLGFLQLTVFVVFVVKSKPLKDALMQCANIVLIALPFFLIPSGIFTLVHREGFVKMCIYLKYFFKDFGGSSSPRGATTLEEIFMERKREKEYEEKKREYEAKIEDIENQEAQIKTKLGTLTRETPAIVPDIIEHIPEDTGLWKGYFGEVERRVQEGQIRKTIQVTRERLEEAKRLWEALAGLHRAKADVNKAWSEFVISPTKVDTENKRLKAEHERVDLESEVKRLELEVKKAELERKKRDFTTGAEDKEKGISPEERLLQSVRDKLKMTEAAGKALGEIEEDRDRTLRSVDREKSPELYQKIKHMYDSLIMDIMEMRKK